MNKRFILVVGLLIGTWALFSVGLTIAGQTQQTSGIDGWTTVFTDTFTNTLSLWTFTETTSTGIQWGVIPYSLTQVNDFGLWAAGGGPLGETQSWYTTDTYTNDMTTLAVAGPITIAGEIAEARVQFDLVNNVDQTDMFSVALSLDGVTFVDVYEVAPPAAPGPQPWQHEEWTSTAVHGAQQVYLIFSFDSDSAGVHMGPLVDNVVLELKTGSRIYLPLIKHDPTPTPTLTPTPIPDYRDDFDDPNSGWYIGPAMRLNRRVYDSGDQYVWEAVNWLDYLNGNYQMYIPLTVHGGGDVDTWFVRTVEYAPMPGEIYPLPENYCVETTAYIAGD
ncbi:MAG: hypothetical protein P1S60_16140, partial [Anaerolineae bacterium]|nr:hypothetical protein [Anaerolineae bacterium]